VNVQEKSTKPVIVEAFKNLTPDSSNAITVTSTSTGEAKTIFDDLQKAAFGKSIAKQISNYGVPAVKSYVITGTATIPNLEAHFK
jgi:hypothetical protein